MATSQRTLPSFTAATNELPAKNHLRRNARTPACVRCWSIAGTTRCSHHITMDVAAFDCPTLRTGSSVRFAASAVPRSGRSSHRPRWGPTRSAFPWFESYQAASASLYDQVWMTGWRFTSSMPAIMRSLSSCFEVTRMWRRTDRANLEKKPSMRLSHEPCLGVKVNSKRPGGRASSQALVSLDMCAE